MQQRAQKWGQAVPPNWGLAHRLCRPRPLWLLWAWRRLLGLRPCCSAVRSLFLAREKQLLLARLQAGQEVLLASALLARVARAVLWGTVWRWMRCRRGQAGGCWPQGFRPATLHRLVSGGIRYFWRRCHTLRGGGQGGRYCCTGWCWQCRGKGGILGCSYRIRCGCWFFF